MIRSDICIAGAGVIGLSLGLELQRRGMRVVIVEAGDPMQQASSAAAGMLAAEDPHNPPELSSLARFSVSLYPAFLSSIHALSGKDVPFLTRRTLQALPGPSTRTLTTSLQSELCLYDSSEASLDLDPNFAFLAEHSIDPRQLAPALIAAVAATSIRTIYNAPVLSTLSTAGDVLIETSNATITAAQFIDCTGAWANTRESHPLFKAVPIKGQMLALAIPPDLQLKTVLRTEDIYIVPRTAGPNAGQAVVGATVEDIGYSKGVEPHAIEALRSRAVSLLPGLANAAVVDSWAGLRPATTDRLPIIGPHPDRPHHWLVTGHYRNGILLAPATACVVAQLLFAEKPSVSLGAFSPVRLVPGAMPIAL